MEATAYSHIEVREDRVPYITGTQTRVEEVVLDHTAYGWDADEIQRQHPDLTLGQIHSALAYYYDHKVEVDQEIEEGLQQVDMLQARLDESLTRRKLAMRDLPS